MRDQKRTPAQTSTPDLLCFSFPIFILLPPLPLPFLSFWPFFLTFLGLLSIMSVTTKATIASFGGKLLKLSHNATTTRCEMSFNLYLPPQAQSQKVPVLIYLSGLTCTADNCSEKGFFQHGASKKGIAVLYPDTSPRASAPATRMNMNINLVI